MPVVPKNARWEKSPTSHQKEPLLSFFLHDGADSGNVVLIHHFSHHPTVSFHLHNENQVVLFSDYALEAEAVPCMNSYVSSLHNQIFDEFCLYSSSHGNTPSIFIYSSTWLTIYLIIPHLCKFVNHNFFYIYFPNSILCRTNSFNNAFFF